MKIVINTAGAACCLCGETIDLAPPGQLGTSRASQFEPDDAGPASP